MKLYLRRTLILFYQYSAKSYLTHSFKREQGFNKSLQGRGKQKGQQRIATRLQLLMYAFL